MTVYVDKLPSGWGKWSGGAHMLASDLDELHAMADRIGLKRAWFQGDKTFAHYDLTASKRALALDAGAVPIGLAEIPEDVLVRNDDGTYEQRSERQARRAAHSQPGAAAVTHGTLPAPNAEQLLDPDPDRFLAGGPLHDGCAGGEECDGVCQCEGAGECA